MTEIKNPFLSEEEDLNRRTDVHSHGDSKVNNIRRGVTAKPVVEGKKFNSGKGYDNLNTERKEDEMKSLEIKENGKILKWLIIIMVVILMLALLGFFLFNLLNKNQQPPANDGFGSGGNVEIVDFDMKAEKFQAKSVIIEK